MQTYKDINVVISDDCSTEDYTGILDVYSSILNIKYIKSEVNSGSGVTRNIGLDNSCGDYICFCDADDTLLNAKSIECMVNDIESDDYDYCSYGYVQEKLDLNFGSTGINNTWIFGKLYKREFLDKYNIRFSEERFNEDVAFCQICEALSNKVYYSPATYYIHHINESSVTKTDDFKKDDKQSFVRNYIKAFEFVKSKVELTDKIKYQFVNGYIIMYFFYALSLREKNKEYQDKLFRTICDYYCSIYDFAPEFICRDDFIDHYLKVFNYHGLHNKKLICTLDWYSFINKVDKVFREEHSSLF